MPPKPTAKTAIDKIDSSKNAAPTISGSRRFPGDLTTSIMANITITAGDTTHNRSSCVFPSQIAATATTYMESTKEAGNVILV